MIAEAVRLARMLPEALKGGFADSLPLQILGARMASRTFEPSLVASSGEREISSIVDLRGRK